MYSFTGTAATRSLVVILSMIHQQHDPDTLRRERPAGREQERPKLSIEKFQVKKFLPERVMFAFSSTSNSPLLPTVILPLQDPDARESSKGLKHIV